MSTSKNSFSNQLYLLIFALLMVSTLSIACKGASQAECGTNSSSCQDYSWVNGTCAGRQCSAQTFWSNATSSCIACVSQNESTCNSFCISYNYYFNSQYQACMKCTITYGTSCTSCNATRCLSCNSGMQVSPSGSSCEASGCKIPNCVACFNSTQCQSCQTGYSVINGVCYCSIDNCKLCHGLSCLQCIDGYQTDVTRKTCQSFCIDNCITCSSYFFCTKCQPNFKYNPLAYACQYNCSLIDSNCLACSTSVTCSQCSSGYSLNFAATKCVKSCSDGNCISCADDVSICTQCLGGWKVNSTSGACVQDVCSINNCLKCHGVSTCQQCASTYQLSTDSTSCLPSCLSTIPNCQACSSTTTCQQCASGYTLANNACTSLCTITNCLQCASATTCMACVAGTLMGYSSLTCQWDCGINGCSNCSSATKCSSCYPGYTISNDFNYCQIICPQGYYLKNGACTFCEGNYCQQCTANGQCIACRDLFYLNQTTYNCHLCSAIDLYCYTCQSTAPICTGCVEGFFLYENKCVITQICTVSNCAACHFKDNSNICIACNDGYALANGNLTCSQIICPGEQFLVGSTCTCGVGAYYWNTKCRPCSSHCVSCSAQLCNLCVIGYYINGKKCAKCSKNCQVCTESTCKICSRDFILYEGGCVPQPDSSSAVSLSSIGTFIICPAGCKTCDVSTSGVKVCTASDDGYALINSILFKCDPSCKTCSGIDSTTNNSQCLGCYKGYSFIGGNCKRCTGTHALTCSQNNRSYSLTCISGYTSSSGVCTACASNCIKCDINKAGNCDKDGCSIGYAQFGSSMLCVSCFNGCATCGNDPNTCTSCLQSQFLSNSQCLPCPTNCLLCSNAQSCVTCRQGYAPTGNGCGVPPGLPCVSYNSNFTCTACDSSYVLNNGACQASLTCNSTKTCSICNFNQYLSLGNCYTCPPLPNCASCSMTNSSVCFQCNKGYYLSISSICVTCPIGCAACNSPNFCTAASSGYYLVATLNGTQSGNFGSCASNCFTCVSQATLCTSCPSGAALTGSQCMNAFYYQISIVGALLDYVNNTNLTSDMEKALFFQIFSLFVKELSQVLNFQSLSDFQQNSLFKSVIHGSLQTKLTLNSASASSQSLSKLNNLKSIKVLSTSSSSNNPQETSSTTNLGLILGITIPLAVLSIIIGIVICTRRSKATPQTKDKNITQTDQEMKEFEYL